MKSALGFAAAVFLAGSCIPGVAAPILLPLSVITIDNSAGAQVDPHVSGDLVSYSDQANARVGYFNFTTNSKQAVPAVPAGIDILSDVSNGRIAFTRVVPAVQSSIMLFDTATPAAPPIEISPKSGSDREGVVLGGNTLVFVDNGTVVSHQPGDIFEFDTSTGILTRITNEPSDEIDPQVAADGSAFVWSRCPSPGVCQIMQAVGGGSSWTTSVTASGSGNLNQADTNGSIAVYSGLPPGNPTGYDLFWTPLAGGAQQQLAMEGTQTNPSISANLVAFESRAVGTTNSDLFLYDLGSGVLYQLTATPDVDESLNDLYVFPDGRINLVWEADDDLDGNIYGAQFQLPGVVVPAPSTALLLTVGLLGIQLRACSSCIRR